MLILFISKFRINRPPVPHFRLPSPIAVVHSAGHASPFVLDSNCRLGRTHRSEIKEQVLQGGDIHDVHTFRRFVDQEPHFLQAFASAYDLAAECADDDDAKHSINELKKAVTDQLKSHPSFVKEWPSEDGKESPVAPATVKLTDFLLATASGKIEGAKDLGNLATPFERTKLAAYTLGVIVPCVRLYGNLAQMFKGAFGADFGNHRYKSWIDKYNSLGFEGATQRTENVLAKLSASLTGEELDTLEKLYHQAMKLKLEFFCSQPVLQTTIVPLVRYHIPAKHQMVLFCDFDLTCTVVDSSAILAEITIVRAPKPDQIQPAEGQITRMSSADLKNSWDAISEQYMDEYEECINRITPPRTVEFKYETLCTALEQVSDFEKMANNRVIESGLLKDLNFEDVRRAGEGLIIQDGCYNFFETASMSENLNVGIHILSYCWCGELIRSSLKAGGLLEHITIDANELVFEEGISTGDLIKTIQSPLDKVVAFRKIMEKYGNGTKKSIYIGDAVGDLLCLIEADIGIVIGSSRTLKKLATGFGISLIPLYPSIINIQKGLAEVGERSSNELPKVLYTLDSWAQIHALVLGC